MKSKLSILLATTALLLAIATACTQNNGHIGRIFGVWRLDAVAVDGVDDTTFDADITWAFQGDIIEIQTNLPHHDRILSFGSFSLTDDESRLLLDFTHSDAANPAGTRQYALPAAMLLPTPATYTCAVDWSGSRAMAVTATRADGRLITYYLTKTY